MMDSAPALLHARVSAWIDSQPLWVTLPGVVLVLVVQSAVIGLGGAFVITELAGPGYVELNTTWLAVVFVLSQYWVWQGLRALVNWQHRMFDRIDSAVGE